jgi:RimJ/RimL family protein N-acetyltransferase
LNFEALETQRLLLRRFQPQDWQMVHEYMSSPAVTAYLPEGQFSQDQARELVTEGGSDFDESIAVMLKEENALIGHMIFHPWFAQHTYEIGWVLHTRYHNQGFATEAAIALLKYGFEKMKLHRIIATCQPENIPSVRVMEKLGLRREGYFQKCIHLGDDRWWDEYFYAMLEEDWFKAA